MKQAKKNKTLWKTDLDVTANLRQRLPKLARKYLRKGRKALHPGTPWDDVHEFRLATKRFRYTLELFRSQYGPGFEHRLDDLKHIQTLLGDANDFVMTSGMLPSTEEASQIREKLMKQAEAKLRKLRSWWGDNFDTEQAEDRWILYLGRFYGGASSKARRPRLAAASKPVRKS